MRKISSNDSIYAIASEYPEIVGIMAELGFSDIVRPGMLQTAGRVMTLAKGSKMKKIDWELIVAKFRESGFDIEEGDSK